MEEQPDLWTPVPDPLPSDARFRLDLDTLLTGDLPAAQAWNRTLRVGLVCKCASHGIDVIMGCMFTIVPWCTAACKA